jgi:hypothetical protein
MLGARRGEICSLRWPDIDFDRGEVLIAGNVVRVPRQGLVRKDTKTHAKRRVAVGAGTLDLLRTHRVEQAKAALACGATLPADAYVFSHVPNGSAPIDPDGVSHRFLTLARRLGVKCRLHDLRHLMVTQLVAGGVDWRTVSGRAGHADGHMTLATYAHFQQAQDRRRPSRRAQAPPGGPGPRPRPRQQQPGGVAGRPGSQSPGGARRRRRQPGRPRPGRSRDRACRAGRLAVQRRFQFGEDVFSDLIRVASLRGSAADGYMVAWTGWVPPVTVSSPSRRGSRQAAQMVRGWKSAPQVCWKTTGSAPGLQWQSPHSLRASRIG